MLGGACVSFDVLSSSSSTHFHIHDQPTHPLSFEHATSPWVTPSLQDPRSGHKQNHSEEHDDLAVQRDTWQSDVSCVFPLRRPFYTS